MTIRSVTLRAFIAGPLNGEQIPADVSDEPRLQTYLPPAYRRLVTYERAVFTHIGPAPGEALCVTGYVHDAVAADRRSRAILEHLISAAT